MYERVNPETLARTPIEWIGGYRSQTGDAFPDDSGAWSFRPYGGAAVSLGFTSEEPVYALRPDCWVRNVWDYSEKPYWRLEIWRSRHAVTDSSWMNAMWSGMKSSRKRG